MQNFISICYETQGRSHLSSNTPCQDKAYSLIKDDNSIAIITLCDGAGSAKHSHYGAETTTEVVAEAISQNFDKYYDADDVSIVAKDILDSTTKALTKKSKTIHEELKDKAYNEIQELLRYCLIKLDSVHCNIHFDYKQELERNKDFLEKSIRELSSTKLKSKEANEDYIKDFRQNMHELWIEYKEKINKFTALYSKYLKKPLFKAKIKKFFGCEDKEKKELKSFIDATKDSLYKESKELNRLLERMESNYANLQLAKQEKIAFIIKDLDGIGKEILELLKKTYRNVNNYSKNIRDMKKMQKAETNLSIIATERKFKDVIAKFMKYYTIAMQKYQDLLDLEIKTKDNEMMKIKSHIKEYDTLTQRLNNAKSSFNSKKESIKRQLEKLKWHKKEQFYKDSDISQISSMQNEYDSLENIRKTCLEFINKKLNKQKDMEKIVQIDIESFVKNIKKEIANSICELKDLASTLLFASIKGNKCLIGHLGDGAIGAIYGGELKCISNPDNGEHANETYFVTTKHAEKAFKIIKGSVKEKNIKSFVLMSDGSTDGLYSKKEGKFIESLQKHILEIRDMKDKKKKQEDIENLIEKVKKERSFDDCSIAILVRV